jgi:hypothetical protein
MGPQHPKINKGRVAGVKIPYRISPTQAIFPQGAILIWFLGAWDCYSFRVLIGAACGQ